MCAMASTRNSFLGAEGMRASIAKDEEGTPETVARAPAEQRKEAASVYFPRGLVRLHPVIACCALVPACSQPAALLHPGYQLRPATRAASVCHCQGARSSPPK